MSHRLEVLRRRVRAWRLPDEGWVRVERDGVTLDLDAGTYLDRRILIDGRWEPSTVALLRDLIRPGMVVADIGANFGYFTLLFSQWVGPTGHVLAFEPVSRYADRLERHLTLNDAANVTLVRTSLSDAEDEVEIAIGITSATMHWATSEAPTSTERIATVPLDRWWGLAVPQGVHRLDVVKLDVDGHELRVLDGGEATLERHKPHIIVEFSQEAMRAAGSDIEDLADRLEQLGYVLCDEVTRRPYADRRALLHAAGNYAYSRNVWARPR